MKIYPIIALFSIIFSNAFAQIFIGPTGGAQYSWTTFGEKEYNSYYKTKPVFGFNAGLGLSFRVRNRFFLTSSILYSTKGKVIEGKSDPLLRHRVTYKYIDIPIIYSVDFRGRFGKDNVFKYFLGIGPNISYWLGGRGKLYNTDYHENGISEVPFRILFDKDENKVAEQEDRMVVTSPNRIQLGLNLAAGLVLEPRANHKFILMFRYEFGHSYLSKESNGVFANTTYQDKLQSRNQGGRVSILYMIDTKSGERKKGKSTIRRSAVKRKRR